MHTPTKSQWQLVIDNFKKILPLAIRPEQLDMSEPAVRNSLHSCGTVCCAGGWYAVAVFPLESTNDYVSYREGIYLINDHLGFSTNESVEDWAHEHPKIWGNEHGISMFYDNNAYNGAITLKGIVEYLEGVRDRSPD